MPRSAKCSQESRHEQDPVGARLSCGPPSEAMPERIHELIQRNQQAGHLLPRELRELTSRNRSLRRRQSTAADRSWRAASSRRSARRSPKSGRSSSARSGAGRGSAGASSTSCRSARERRGFDDLCVFAHQPAYFAHMGFSIVPHTWLPEKIMADCRSCPLFRRCEQFAMVTDLDAVPEVQPARSAACLTQPLAPKLESRRIDGGITAPAGFKAAGVYAGIKPPTHAWPLDVMLMTADRPASAAAVFTTNKTHRGAGRRLARRTWSNPAAARRRSSATAAARTRAPATRGMEVARSTVEFVARQAGMPARRGARRVDRRHRRRSRA